MPSKFPELYARNAEEIERFSAAAGRWIQQRWEEHGHVLPVVLLVEDDANVLKAFSRLIRPLAREVRTATTVAEAIAALAVRPWIDLLLLDEKLPNGSGVRVARAVRAQPEIADIPILVVSGVEPDVIRAKYCEVAGVDVLLKGDLDALVRAVRDSYPVARFGTSAGD